VRGSCTRYDLSNPHDIEAWLVAHAEQVDAERVGEWIEQLSEDPVSYRDTFDFPKHQEPRRKVRIMDPTSPAPRTAIAAEAECSEGWPPQDRHGDG
jgi:hypothetical protein